MIAEKPGVGVEGIPFRTQGPQGHSCRDRVSRGQLAGHADRGRHVPCPGAAGAVGQYLREMSAEAHRGPEFSAESLFENPVARFLASVWPHEVSLVTPGISNAFADIPASSGAEFPAAVQSIERFIVPFDCWSMLDFGLYGDEDGQPKLSHIDNKSKAEALLTLLDRSIGPWEGAVVPHDLVDALDQIRSASADLTSTQQFRRLATLARRH